MSLFLLILTLSQSIHTSLAANICYLPDGTTNKDVPCDPNALVTQCCGMRSACLTNGLCILTASNDTGISYACGTCTDRSWASPLCPQQCHLSLDTPTNQSAYDFRSGGVQVWQFGSQGYGRNAEYCCESGAEKTRCCSTESAVFTLLAASVGPSTSASTTSVASSVSRARSSSPGPIGTPTRTESAAASTSTATSMTSRIKSNTRTIGIGAGVGGDVALYFGRGHNFLRRRHKRQHVTSASELPSTVMERENKKPTEVWTQPQQLPSQASPPAVWELPGDTQRHSKTPRLTG